MGQEFEGQDLSDSVFWGVDLSRSYFRDADFSGTSMFHVRLADVSIDGDVTRLVVNGVDVTDYVNQHDRWYPLRAMLEPGDGPSVLRAWDRLQQEWDRAIEQATALTDDQRRASVNGEWSFLETLRHLVMAMDKWFTMPVLGHTEMAAFVLPNRGSDDVDWPGRDKAADPSFDEVVAVRRQRAGLFRGFVVAAAADDLHRAVTVMENGETTALQCTHVVLEEEFEHLRYALRDLAVLTGR